MNIRERVAKNIIDRRKSIGLSQEGLARQAGLSRAYVGKIENARFAVTIDTIEKIAHARTARSSIVRRSIKRTLARGATSVTLGSLRLFAAACANAGFGEDQGPGDLGQCLHANQGLNGTLVWNGPESSGAYESARAIKTPPAAEIAVTVAPQTMSAATMEGCQSRIIAQEVSS
jgi:transcriptional regulator with XRE-family HTH domain